MNTQTIRHRPVVRGALALALSAAWLAVPQSALALVTLQPVNISNSSGTQLTISAPLRPSGRMSELSLRADSGSSAVASVRYDIYVRKGKDFGDAIHTQLANRAPFCLFEAASGCGARKIGERLPNSQSKVAPGAYRVRVFALNTDGAELWSGEVFFVIAPTPISLGLPPNGTYDGQGIFVDWRDPAFSPAGVDRLNMEIRASTTQTGANGAGIGYALFTLFRIGATPDDKTEVYRRHELNLPYCMFGEESDGKTCRTVGRGERFPASSVLIDEGDPSKGKRDDPSLARVRLLPGEYEIEIKVSPKDQSASGFWGGRGRFVVVGN